MLQSVELQRVRQDKLTEQQQSFGREEFISFKRNRKEVTSTIHQLKDHYENYC